jgi:adenine phosphoribosyltransferase
MEELLASLDEAPIIEKDGYQYLVHPISNGVPTLEPTLLREVTDEVVDTIGEDVDKIVVPEAMGIHIGTAVSLETDIPLTVIRKRQYGLENEQQLSKETGYASSEMYINDIHPEDRIVVLDDLLSTGGTLAAICEGLEKIGCDIADIIVVFRKVDTESALEETAHRATSLVDITVAEDSVTVHGARGTILK